MVKAFIFDVGNVLVDGPSWDSIIKEFNLKVDEVYHQRVIRRYQSGKIDEDTFWKLFLRKFKATKALPQYLLIRRCKKDLIRRFNEETKIKTNVLKIATALKKKGYLLAVLSNMSPGYGKYLEKLGFFKNFDAVVLSYKVHFLKPQPAIYRLTLRKLKIKPREAVFIDNKIENVKGAEKLGIKAILFTSAIKLKKDIKKALST